MNDKGVCKTAPATLVILITVQHPKNFMKHVHFKVNIKKIYKLLISHKISHSFDDNIEQNYFIKVVLSCGWKKTSDKKKSFIACNSSYSLVGLEYWLSILCFLSRLVLSAL